MMRANVFDKDLKMTSRHSTVCQVTLLPITQLSYTA